MSAFWERLSEQLACSAGKPWKRRTHATPPSTLALPLTQGGVSLYGSHGQTVYCLEQCGFDDSRPIPFSSGAVVSVLTWPQQTRRQSRQLLQRSLLAEGAHARPLRVSTGELRPCILPALLGLLLQLTGQCCLGLHKSATVGSFFLKPKASVHRKLPSLNKEHTVTALGFGKEATGKAYLFWWSY